MIEIILSMIKKIFVFAILMILIIFMYTLMGRILFIETSEFFTYRTSFLYLFGAMLGDFNLGFAENINLKVHVIYSYVFIISYLIVTNIVMLNFLIAILSDIYSVLQQKSSQLYLTNIIRMHQIASYSYEGSPLVLFITRYI